MAFADDLWQASFATPQPVRDYSGFYPGFTPTADSGGNVATDNEAADGRGASYWQGTKSMGALNKVFGWQMLKEPFWKWIVFILALSFFFGAWRGVIGYMK